MVVCTYKIDVDPNWVSHYIKYEDGDARYTSSKQKSVNKGEIRLHNKQW